MRAEVIAIGSELLLGDHVDTNSAHVSRRLAEIGVDVHHHVTVGDNAARLGEVLSVACRRADVVIATGGLGPTSDDITREVVASVAGVGLQRNSALAEAIAAYFQQRGRAMPANNLRQADLPGGAWVIDPVGTAPGFGVTVGDAVVYCLPGVPREMTVMLDRHVLPELVERGGLATTVSRVVRTSGLSESGVSELLGDLVGSLEEAGNPTIAFLASAGTTRVRVTGKAGDRDEALALVDPVVAQVVALLGEGVTGLDDEGVEFAVAQWLRRLGLTLAVAESVTGGRVASRLVTVPGASDWFRGGLVTYATDTKTSAAGVDPALLEREGPVSAAVAEALAAGAAERLAASVGLSVVGVAGPTTQGGRSVGTAIIGWCGPDGMTRSREVSLPGQGREDLQVFAASAALEYARRRLAAVT